MCISFAQAVQAGWHTNAWSAARGVDTNACLNLQGLRVVDVFTQTASDGNDIAAVALPSQFGYEPSSDYSNDGRPPSYEGVTMPASTNSARSLTNDYYAILGWNLSPDSWNSAANLWTNTASATNAIGEAYSITTRLDRTYSIYPATNDATRVPIDTASFEVIRDIDIFLALSERAEYADDYDDLFPELYASLLYRAHSDNLGGMKSFGYNVDPGAYPDYLTDLIESYIIPMDSYEDWFNTASVYEWQDTDADGTNDTWVLAYPQEFPRWTAVSICESNALPVQAFTNSVTNTVFGWEAGQFDTYEVEDYVHDDVTYETYLDHSPPRDLFMVSNTAGRVQSFDYRFNAFEIAEAEGIFFAMASWNQSHFNRLPSPDGFTPYGILSYDLAVTGEYSTVKSARLIIEIDNTAEGGDYTAELYNHLFTNSVWTNIAITVTNDEIAAGFDLEDYDIAGLKEIIEDLYVVEVDGVLYADPLRTKYAAGSVDTSDGDYWEDAKTEAETNWASSTISSNNWDEIDRFFDPHLAAIGGVYERFGGAYDTYVAGLYDFTFRLAITNTQTRAASFDAYMVFDDPRSYSFKDTETTIDGASHSYTGRCVPIESGRLLAPSNTWTDSEWTGGGSSLSSVPAWCDEPTKDDPPYDESDEGYVSRGYDTIIKAIIRLNVTNGFEYITIEE